MRFVRRLCAVLLAMSVIGVPAAEAHGPPPHGPPPPPRPHHVFTIVLENEGESDDLRRELAGAYLAQDADREGRLPPQLLRDRARRASTTTSSMISGQAPNPVTQGDCLFYTDVTPGARTGADGQVARAPAASIRPR